MYLIQCASLAGVDRHAVTKLYRKLYVLSFTFISNLFLSILDSNLWRTVLVLLWLQINYAVVRIPVDYHTATLINSVERTSVSVHNPLRNSHYLVRHVCFHNYTTVLLQVYLLFDGKILVPLLLERSSSSGRKTQ